MLSEQHPREQGLKLEKLYAERKPFALSEQHPREQGLKHVLYFEYMVSYLSFRATSKRTRIETLEFNRSIHYNRLFQSNIQENKD